MTFDVVYTWVDDQFAGYQELLRAHGRGHHDLNPNRTRDNLELLRYSLRSLERYAPWVGNVYLVSIWPQVPPWLDTRRVTVVHHDELIDATYLPTFNSFAIASHLYKLPPVSERFLYFEDDYLLGRAVDPSDWLTADGRFRLWPKREWGAAPHRAIDEAESPWNRTIANSNRLLDAAYRPEPRRLLHHGPMLIDRALYGAMVDRWRPDFERTWASPFRATGNVAAEHLYPYALWYERRAVMVPLLRSHLTSYYQGIDNILPQQWLQFAYLRKLRPKLICLNDNFGDTPWPSVVRLARRYLEESYPTPSRFELVS